MKHASLFKDPGLNARFHREGYVTVDFLSPDAADALAAFYGEQASAQARGFHTTHFSRDPDYKQRIHEAIVQALTPGVDRYLNDYVPVFGNFMVKESDDQSSMPLHADWTYVDESRYTGISVWVPLTDTHEQNGCLGVIPRSHELSHPIRGPRILQWEAPCGEQLIAALGRLLPLKKGQAVLYDQRLLHYSPPNRSGKVRPAVNLAVLPRQAERIHYTLPEGESLIHRFRVEDPLFFLRYNNFQMPELGRAEARLEPGIPLINARAGAFIKAHKKNWLKKLLSVAK